MLSKTVDKCLTSLQVADDLNPLRVLSLFSAITAEDCILLDIADRPEFLLMTHIPVPPVCIRPSVDMDSGQGSNEDDLTVRLRVCIRIHSAEACLQLMPWHHDTCNKALTCDIGIASSLVEWYEFYAEIYIIAVHTHGLGHGWWVGSLASQVDSTCLQHLRCIITLQDIILYNSAVKQDLEKGDPIAAVMEHWDMLQVNCAAYINSDLPGLPPNHAAVPSKPTRYTWQSSFTLDT